MPRDWDPSRPWSCVFMQLASDMEFWAERVHHPAAAWTAAGGRGAPTGGSGLRGDPGWPESDVHGTGDNGAPDRHT